MVDSTTSNHPTGTSAGFMIAHSWDWGGGGALLYQDFDSDYGRLYTNSKQCDATSYGGWKKVAWTSDIPTVTNYYWANVKISDKSSTSTSPTFAYPTSIYSQFTNGSKIIGYVGRGGSTNNLYFGNYETADVCIFTNNDTSTSIYLKTGGKVGIGTNNPSNKRRLITHTFTATLAGSPTLARNVAVVTLDSSFTSIVIWSAKSSVTT